MGKICKQMYPPPSTLGCNPHHPVIPSLSRYLCFVLKRFLTLARNDKKKAGFTLVELSIVLVIIGLLVGGVLVGRDLIRAAEIRSQISQFERMNAAANTFRVKYNYLPGDIQDPDATQLGLAARIPCATGHNHGNGWIDFPDPPCPATYWDYGGPTGEGNLFWVDLNTTGVMPNRILVGDLDVDVSGSDIAKYLPTSPLADDLYVYVWGRPGDFVLDGYFNIKRRNFLSVASNTRYCSNNACTWMKPYFVPTVRVIDVYNVDTKIDDGLPQSGRITASYVRLTGSGNSGSALWAEGVVGSHSSGAYHSPVDLSAITQSSTTCYDNGGVNGAVRKYSISQDGGSGMNCAITYEMQ
jgi:prepilin-type N-terminal cleavage/methylation domain-containing protein